MCKVNTLKLNDRTIRVADLKRDFIRNIAESIALCDHIQKVVLFGSCLESRCKETSDIDIAAYHLQQACEKLIKIQIYQSGV